MWWARPKWAKKKNTHSQGDPMSTASSAKYRKDGEKKFNVSYYYFQIITQLINNNNKMKWLRWWWRGDDVEYNIHYSCFHSLSLSLLFLFPQVMSILAITLIDCSREKMHYINIYRSTSHYSICNHLLFFYS